MQRRAALLAVLVLLLAGLAGCSAAGSLSMQSVPNATALADQASLDVTQLDNESHRLAIGALTSSPR